jgi:putative ABC transport system ATP-binding protein
MIETRNLTKDYRMGGTVVHALRSVDVTIEAGEFVAVMGPSGSGKSTFMNLLGCLDRPTSGEYLFEGQDVSEFSDGRLAELRNRSIGFVFQTFNLIPRKSALANVELPLLYGSTSNRTARATRALEAVGLAERMRHRPSSMSGGEQQRVAIARAVVNEPLLILGDEPTGNLDSRTSEEIMAVFQDLNRQGRTVVLVTHEEDIARHCHRIIRFRDGSIVQDEPVKAPIDLREALAQSPPLDQT